jgi:hypothetical protein
LATTPTQIAAKLSRLLRNWADRSVDERYVHESAEELIETTGWIDFPRSHQCSIAYEVMSSLALLNHQWITVDDIPELLSVLELGRKDPKLAWARWEKFWNEFDFDDRKRQLQGSDYYCGV